jgi:uncharacterized protein (TIGR00290 family)
MALYELQKSTEYEVLTLLTTVTEGYDRVSMHGLRSSLLDMQARSLRTPLEQARLPMNASNEAYEERFKEVLLRYREKGVSSVAFGDVFLEDIREYRERNLSEVGMKAIFPIWKRDSDELARTFIREGFRAITICVDTDVLDETFVGRSFDEGFLARLPSNVDPCGENGEFHSFVYAGPIFHEPIGFKKGEIVLRDNRFCFCDLIPK